VKVHFCTFLLPGNPKLWIKGLKLPVFEKGHCKCCFSFEEVSHLELQKSYIGRFSDISAVFSLYQTFTISDKIRT
jgi:hypothetical protein